MNSNLVVMYLNFGAAFAAFAAAYLWHKSATVKVPHKDEPDASGMYPAAIITDDNTDFIETASAQSVWSKRGAYAAAIAAALQGLALLIQSVAA
ncbi:hypothetical protein [Ectopseudomonas mendocina]|uniref:hypothetical protein n=1 Tax=Ectopseudomonas mendocina TaxID=300 RepID=UPI000F81B33E|nr:hypothetical protein [Pseudomonas mendocina]